MVSLVPAGLAAEVAEKPHTTVAPAPARPAAQNPDAIRAAMESSIRKQKESVRRQVGSAVRAASSAVPSVAAGELESRGDDQNGFYTVSWPQPPSFTTFFSQANADCDPLPDADLNPLIANAATREGVKPELIRAVMKHESAFRPCAVSPKGAQGLMQLMPSTAEQFHIADPFDPGQNVDAGTKLLKQLLSKYDGNLKLVLGAYNAGSGRVDEAGDVPLIPETQGYVADILNDLEPAGKRAMPANNRKTRARRP